MSHGDPCVRASARPTPQGELLMLGANMLGYEVGPDLSFLGLQVTDSGAACGLGSSSCSYRVNSAHFSARGQTGQQRSFVHVPHESPRYELRARD